jgi:Na+-translocating ferredoxin:NAD+ oxidoreductase RnfE subunit
LIMSNIVISLIRKMVPQKISNAWFYIWTMENTWVIYSSYSC